jgi:hypothetical protein
VVGRGVLVDFLSYAERNELEYDPFVHFAVPLDAVEKILKESKIELQGGEILFLRTGKCEPFL